jgi:DNA-binding NtrC family response regulator/tetratricopeptide (TPR) repeat protein
MTEKHRRGPVRPAARNGVIEVLAEGDALVDRGRAAEAVELLTRALLRRPAGADEEARLRLLRGHALWLSGRVRPGQAEVRRGLGLATEPLTRARGLETLGLLAWKAQDLEEARRLLEEAMQLYEAHGCAEGVARVLEKEAGVLRDLGRLTEALRVQERRLALVSSMQRGQDVALARADRGSLLAALGRWQEARVELEAAAAFLRELADPRLSVRSSVARAEVDLAAGELAAARSALERAREGEAHGDPRTSGETLVVTSDLHLAAGDPRASEAAAAEALGFFAAARDRGGECRSRVRRVHALLALGRTEEAVGEGRRAARTAPASRPDLLALSHIALGRALLRRRPTEARAAFDRALTCAAGRAVFEHAARLGRALCDGAGRDHPEVRGALAGLEAWGDRRVLASCLAEVRERLGVALVAEGAGALVSPTEWRGASIMVDAAVALAGEGDWPARWSGAMQALRPAVTWWRAALVERRGWVVTADAAPEPLSEAHAARAVVTAHRSPCILDLALLAPIDADRTLYLDRRDGQPGFSEGELALASELGRLLAAHPSEDADHAGEAPGFPGLVGSCPAMLDLLRTVARVAVCEATVHLHGETGTGKERVAQAIHRHSGRRGVFVAVNASSLTDELFESEMCGHVKGAFTSAVADRAGHLAEAEGGTLFLDEVTDLSPRAQGKLLRLLQEKEYRRLGESRSRRADVRFVTAANVSLEERAAGGELRKDLMYRLNRIVLTLPPLRERGEDIARLARHLLRAEAAKAGGPAPVLPADVMRALERYAWPGNVRELENEIGRIVLRAGKGPVRREHLSPALLGPPSAAASPLKHAVFAFERDHIARALARHGGNRARTACSLGLTRQALVAKISRLGISAAHPR